MADINDVTEGEELEQEAQGENESGSEMQQEAGNQGQAEQEDDEVIVSIGDVAPPSEDEKQHEAAPQWVKDLRRESREKDKLIRELKAQQAAAAPVQKKTEALPMPQIDDDGIDFDKEVFNERLSAWMKNKQQVEAEQAAQEKEQEVAKAAWQESVGKYEAAKAKLKVPDFAEAEAVVVDILSQAQQGIIVDGAARPDLIIYALGKSPEKAKELSSIKNPVKFAFAVANLEKELKVTQKKAPPPPEKTVRGNAAVAPNDARLEALEAEAEKTGNRNKIIAYKKQLAAK